MRSETKPVIVGVGRTKFGEHFGKGLGLLFEAVQKCFEDCRAKRNDLDAIYTGSFVPELTLGEGFIPAYASQEAGLNIPIFFDKAACASGSSAFFRLCNDIQTGRVKRALLALVENLTSGDATFALATAASEAERVVGSHDFTTLYANIALRHMYDFGTTKKQLAMVRAKNQKHAKDNPNAQFPFEIPLEKILNSRVIAYPLTLHDCSPISDGGAAVFVVPEDEAHSYDGPHTRIIGRGCATDFQSMGGREIGKGEVSPLTSLKATKLAFEMALNEATKNGVSRENLHSIPLFIELHDCFTIEEILAMEDMGFWKKGDGGKNVEEAWKEFENEKCVLYGKKLVNAGGGLEGDGHPVGATFGRQLGEVHQQLTGKSLYPRKKFMEKWCGKAPEVGIVHNIGGTGGAAFVFFVEVFE